MNNNLKILNEFEHLKDNKLTLVTGGRNKMAYNVGKAISRIMRRVR